MSEQDVGSNRAADHPILGAVSPGRIIAATIDGRKIYGYEGEPVAAMLLAHGIRTFRTMPETGNLRGAFTADDRVPDVAMIVNGELNVPVTMTPLREGMVISTQRGLGDWEESSNAGS